MESVRVTDRADPAFAELLPLLTRESVHSYYRDRDLWPIRLLDYDRNALGEVTGIEVDSEGELYVLAGGVHRVRPAGERG